MTLFARIVALGAVAGTASAALGTDIISSYDFTQDLTLDFNGVAPGTIAYPSAIVPGAAFSSDSQGPMGTPFLSRGGVVLDEGGGDHALNLINFGAAPVHFSILIKFDTPFTAFAATWTNTSGTDIDGNPAYYVYDAAGNVITAFGSTLGINGPEVFGAKNLDTPGSYIEITFSQSGVNGENWNIDDLAVDSVPAPGVLAGAGVLGLGALRRRRR